MKKKRTRKKAYKNDLLEVAKIGTIGLVGAAMVGATAGALKDAF